MSESDDNWDLPVFSPDSEEQENIELVFLPVIPEWIHEECKRRAREQWEAMLPVTGFDEDSKQYHLAKEPVTSVTEEQLRGVQIVQALYQKPLVSPTGEVVELNDDILAWWAEYSSQWTFSLARESWRRRRNSWRCSSRMGSDSPCGAGSSTRSKRGNLKIQSRRRLSASIEAI